MISYFLVLGEDMQWRETFRDDCATGVIGLNMSNSWRP